MTIYVAICPICSETFNPAPQSNYLRPHKTCGKSCASKLRWQNPGYKERVGVAIGNKLKEKYASGKYTGARRRTQSAQERQMRRSWYEDPEYMQRHHDGLLQRWSNTEYKAIVSASMSKATEHRIDPCNGNSDKNTMKGIFKPSNPSKYKGNPTTIVFRSSYELKLMMRLDNDDRIIQWQSEEMSIPYRSPATGRIHRYFVDFIIKTINNETIMVEVKPEYQVLPPILKEGKKITKAYKRSVVTYAINQAKWAAAKAYCDDRGWKFQIMSEKELGIK